MKKVRVGIIGLGTVAQVIHLPILDALQEKFEISAICDISPSLLEHISEKYRVDRIYTSAEALCSDPQIDAVFILNSDESHADSAVAALKNKKHVLLEKPICLTLADADRIIRAKNESGVQVMVGYMRRYAPAFTQAVEEVKQMDRIVYARIRDIIGPNAFFINQSSEVFRPADIPQAAMENRVKREYEQVLEAIGDAPEHLIQAYRLLTSLSSHDISAMREIIGVPNRVVSATQWKGGHFLHAIFEYDDFHASFETGTHNIGLFDAHIEVYSETKSCKVQYDTPYIRHLPTTLEMYETKGTELNHSIIRPTYRDPYTVEIEEFYKVVTEGWIPKTTPEDAKEDLVIFRQIIDAIHRG